MYGARAELYDILYAFKDYAAEAADIRARLAACGVADGARVLEAACGTAEHLRHLAAWYPVDGFDLAEGMLRRARGKLPEGRFFQADMAALQVEAPYDALLCLFSSIGYVLEEERLRATARGFFAALAPGGVALVEPWLRPEVFQPGRPMIQTGRAEGIEVARGVVSQREGERSVMDFHWIVARQGAPEAEHFVERHELWLCPHSLLVEVFEAAGFECELDPEGLTGRGLLVALRPQA